MPMDVSTAKYIIWAMLCIPLLVFGIYMLNDLTGDILGILRIRKARHDKLEQKRLEEEKRRWERERFEADYDYYQKRKYSDRSSKE